MSEPAGHDSASQLPPGREIVPPRPLLVQAHRIVIKVGSTLVTNSGQGLDSAAILRLAEQIATLRAQGKEVVLVSSGAVAEGMLRLGWKKRPSEMHSLQAAAAVGQMGLANVYEECFRHHGMKTAQILLTHDDLANRRRYLNARSTLLTLLKLGVVPIINENDTVVTDEIKFGDNDTLAALVTNLIEAEVLVILTDQEGLYTADPRKDPAAVMLASVQSGDPELERMAGDVGSIFGRGGMATKVLAAKRAATSGAHTIIASGRQQDALTRMAAGEAIGTQFIARTARLTARKQWLSGHLQVRGSLKLDAGAARALAQGGKSLLAIGITEVRGDFERGELVACLDADGKEIARGLVNYASAETRRIMGKASSKIGEILGYVEEPELMHRDNLVLR